MPVTIILCDLFSVDVETQPDTSELDVISEVTLPAYLQALIKQDRQQFEEWTMDMTNMREKSIANGKARHEEVTRLYLMLPPKPGKPAS